MYRTVAGELEDAPPTIEFVSAIRNTQGTLLRQSPNAPRDTRTVLPRQPHRAPTPAAHTYRHRHPLIRRLAFARHSRQDLSTLFAAPDGQPQPLSSLAYLWRRAPARVVIGGPSVAPGVVIYIRGPIARGGSRCTFP